MEDADGTQEAETAIPRLHQVTTGTQTESGDSLQGALDIEPETAIKRGNSLKHTDRDNVFWTIPAQKHESEMKKLEKGQSRDPCEGCAH